MTHSLQLLVPGPEALPLAGDDGEQRVYLALREGATGWCRGSYEVGESGLGWPESGPSSGPSGWVVPGPRELWPSAMGWKAQGI